MGHQRLTSQALMKLRGARFQWGTSGGSMFMLSVPGCIPDVQK